MSTDSKLQKDEVKTEKLVVKIPGQEFDENLHKIEKLETEIDFLTNQLNTAKSFVKDIGIKTFEDIYIQNSKYPGSFILLSDSSLSIAFVPSDKYLKCDDDKINNLKDTYGDDIISENIEYSLNSDLVNKYGKFIFDFIENCPDILDRDKNKIIQRKVGYSVKKGSIEIALKWGKDKISDFIKDIQPIFSLKGVKK